MKEEEFFELFEQIERKPNIGEYFEYGNQIYQVYSILGNTMTALNNYGIVILEYKDYVVLENYTPKEVA